MKIEYRAYHARTMLNKLKHVDDWLWVRYTLNPYRGCAHLCVYCDARANQYGLAETFEQVVYVKENAREVLESQLAKLKRDIVGMGGVCDAYQPVEAERRVTRSILETLAGHSFPVGVLSKSDLVLRDLDILQGINSVAWAGVLFTVATCDPAVVSRFEPYAPSPERRLAALKRVAEAGLTTGVMLCPHLPGISDHEAHLDEVVRRARDCGAQFILHGGLTLKEGAQKTRFLEALEQYYPHLLPQYRSLYRTGYSPSRDYSCRVSRLVRETCQRYGIPDRMPRPVWDDDELSINKRIAERLFLKTYDLELQQANGYRIWAYRKAAWAIDEWTSSLEEIYSTHGTEGLRELPGIGEGIAGEIAGWLTENPPRNTS